MHLRPLCRPSAEALGRYVVFRHSGCTRSESILLVLPLLATEGYATDNNGAYSTTGLSHGTALAALGIVANLSFETAYLSYDRQGDDAVRLLREGILMLQE